jgi:hypothetical protein
MEKGTSIFTASVSQCHCSGTGGKFHPLIVRFSPNGDDQTGVTFPGLCFIDVILETLLEMRCHDLMEGSFLRLLRSSKKPRNPEATKE